MNFYAMKSIPYLGKSLPVPKTSGIICLMFKTSCRLATYRGCLISFKRAPALDTCRHLSRRRSALYLLIIQDFAGGYRACENDFPGQPWTLPPKAQPVCGVDDTGVGAK